MAENTSKKPSTAKKTSSGSSSKSTGPAELGRSGPLWKEAWELESALEEKLLEDAIMSARLALQELEDETRKAPFERRSGLRLKEKAIRTERAFNRLRALRKGELLPNPHPDD